MHRCRHSFAVSADAARRPFSTTTTATTSSSPITSSAALRISHSVRPSSSFSGTSSTSTSTPAATAAASATRAALRLRQQRWVSAPPKLSPRSTSKIKQVEAAALSKAKPGGRAVSLSVDQVFRRHRNRAMKEGKAPDMRHWDRLNLAWSLIPQEKKTRLVSAESEKDEIEQIMATLEETGAMRKAAQELLAREVRSADAEVDEKAMLLVCALIAVVVALTYLSVSGHNSAAQQASAPQRKRRSGQQVPAAETAAGEDEQAAGSKSAAK
eukprot:Rhum_TRINITY_DN17326_c0_g1::Rhum_TRINITY_DN17326_c0_g1_i1::g.165778::m.165778